MENQVKTDRYPWMLDIELNVVMSRPVWRGVSKGVEDGRRSPALWAGQGRAGQAQVKL